MNITQKSRLIIPHIVIYGDFNVHYNDWLSSSKTDPQAKNFAISNSLTNLLTETTYFPRVISHAKNPLDLFLTTHPDPYETLVSATLVRSDHGLLSISFPSNPTPIDISPPRSLWQYKRTNWEG